MQSQTAKAEGERMPPHTNVAHVFCNQLPTPSARARPLPGYNAPSRSCSKRSQQPRREVSCCCFSAALTALAGVQCVAVRHHQLLGLLPCLCVAAPAAEPGWLPPAPGSSADRASTQGQQTGRATPSAVTHNMSCSPAGAFESCTCA
jgi:hypothetical protein